MPLRHFKHVLGSEQSVQPAPHASQVMFVGPKPWPYCPLGHVSTQRLFESFVESVHSVHTVELEHILQPFKSFWHDLQVRPVVSGMPLG